MTWRELAEFAALPGMSVGGHSHTHRIMSFLDRTELEHEVDLSLNLLNQHAGIETSHYSYPEGLAHCYSDEVIEVLKSRGIDCCPTAIDGMNPASSDTFHLRRIPVV